MAYQVRLDLSVPLIHRTYSPTVQGNAQNVIYKLFEKINLSGIDLSQITFSFDQHKIQLFKAGKSFLTIASNFNEKVKSATIQWKSRIGEQPAECKELKIHDGWFQSPASDLRSALKELARHHQYLTGKGLDFSPASRALMQPLSASPVLEFFEKIKPSDKVSDCLAPLSDVMGILRNVLGLAFAVSRCKELAVLMAAMQIVQGLMSICKGLNLFISSWERYREAEKLHDLEGMKMARADMIDGALNILMGACWIALGALIIILFIHSGIDGIEFSSGLNAYNVTMDALFYGGFTLDALLGIYSSWRKLQSVRQQMKPLEEIIHSKLTDDEKRKAFLRYFRSMLKLTSEEEKKIREKLPDKAEERILEKLAKKRALSIRAYGKKNVKLIERIVTASDDASLLDISASLDIVIDWLQEKIFQTRCEQGFVILMGLLSAVVTFSGLPEDIDDASWLGINFLYLFLDSKTLNDSDTMNGVGQKISGAIYRNFVSSEQKDRKYYMDLLEARFAQIETQKREAAQRHEEELKQAADKLLVNATPPPQSFVGWIWSLFYPLSFYEPGLLITPKTAKFTPLTTC